MRHHFRDRWYTTKELEDMSGIPGATIRDRLRRGYTVEQAVTMSPVHESVSGFCEASWWEDWIGMSISDLHGIYWRWSIQNGYSPLQCQGFSRQMFQIYPQLKSVPTKGKRIIRKR